MRVLWGEAAAAPRREACRLRGDKPGSAAPVRPGPGRAAGPRHCPTRGLAPGSRKAPAKPLLPKTGGPRGWAEGAPGVSQPRGLSTGVLGGGWGCVPGARSAGPASTLAAASQACGSLFLLIWQDPEGPGARNSLDGGVSLCDREWGTQRARPPSSLCTADHMGPDLGPAAPPPPGGARAFGPRPGPANE